MTGGAQGAEAPSDTRFRLASPTTAAVVAVLTGVLVAAVVALSLLNHDPQADLASNMPLAGIALAFAAVGFVVARQQSHNAIGWILLASAQCILLSEVGTTYSVLDYRLHQGSLPLGWVAVSMGFFWLPWLMLMALPILLFPTGNLPSPRWRWSLWVYAIAGGMATISALVAGAIIGLGRHVHILADGSANTNNLSGLLGVLTTFPYLCALTVFALWLVWTVRLLASYRHSKGDSRQQLKWLMGGGIVTIVATATLVADSPNQTQPGMALVVLITVLLFGFAGLPVGIGVGVLKYRLYDVDRLISRTLSYTIVTGLLIGVYVGLVTLATRILPFSSPLGVAASTLAAAALFTPLRTRVQRLVDRRFNRARYDAEATVSLFARRVRDDVDLDTVRSEFVRAVMASVEPAHISLWLQPTASRT